MTTPFPLNASTQIAEKSILDAFNKQIYLGNGFIKSLAISLGDTNEDVQLSIANPSISSKALFVITRQISASALVTARFYINPTGLSAGSATTPVNLRPAYSATSVATCKTTPTVSGNGTLISSIASNGPMNTSNILVILDPGKTLLMTAQAATGTPTCIIETVWYEI